MIIFSLWLSLDMYAIASVLVIVFILFPRSKGGFIIHNIPHLYKFSITKFYKTIPNFTKPCPSFTSLRFLFNM